LEKVNLRNCITELREKVTNTLLHIETRAARTVAAGMPCAAAVVVVYARE